MALPKWFWDQEAVSANWAWAWQLKRHQRREALGFADEGKRHPDHRVASVANQLATTRRSTRYFTIEMIITVVTLVVFTIILKRWTGLPVTGGMGAAAVGVATAIWRQIQASRLSKVYQRSTGD